MTPDQEAKLDALIAAVKRIEANVDLWSHSLKDLRERVALLESHPPEAAQ